jgi:hypothetical protein
MRFLIKCIIFVTMNMQTVLILIIFTAAVLYIGRMMYKNLFAKKSCGGNCKCGVDFSGIEPNKSAN